jgi:hypothetical protein
MLSWQPNYLLQPPARMAKTEKIQSITIRREIEKIWFTILKPRRLTGVTWAKSPRKSGWVPTTSAPKSLAKRAELLNFVAAPDEVNHLTHKYTYIAYDRPS